MAASQEKGDKFELAALNPQTNGDRTEHPTPDSMAVPKHIAGRKQSSSKKFKIESVSVCDDPLYNSDASSPSRLRKLGKETAIDKLPYPPPEAKTSLPFVDSTRVKPEVGRLILTTLLIFGLKITVHRKLTTNVAYRVQMLKEK